MKRHYTSTDLNILRWLSEPGWADADKLFNVYLGMRPKGFYNSSLMTIHASLCRLVTDNLVELRWADNDLSARRLSLPASLSRILAA